jgi:orotidine-5'-phosphate decarboxylase
VRTSNPGAADVMDAELKDGGRVWERLAGLADELGTPGPASGLKDVGAVTGATEPAHLARMRELMPHTPFLLPGVGAQGAVAADVAAAFENDVAGGLVSASRSVIFADSPAQAAERLAREVWDAARAA